MSDTIVTMTAPGMRQFLPPPFGPVARINRDPLGFMLDGLRRYGDVFRFQVGPLVFHQIAHPDHIKHVLLDNQKNYPRSWYYKRARIGAGEGLVTTEGAPWRRLRRMAQPAFHRQRIEALAGTMTGAIDAMRRRWQARVGSGPIDVAAELVALTLRIVGRALMTIDLADASDRLAPAITAAMAYTASRLKNLLGPPSWMPTPNSLRFRRAIRTLDALFYRVIAERRRQPGTGPDDLLAMLLIARDEETGQGLTDRELRDQLLTFIVAGHETTAVALGWTLYLLDRNPPIARRLRDEVDAALGDRIPTAADLPGLPYVRQVIEESMRLYPPVYGLIRDAKDDDVIGGYRIPARSMVLLSLYATHRHPAFWPDPEVFDPDRFAPDQVAARPRFAWFPFLGGPHQCIGQDFAMMEAVLVVAMLAQRFRLELAPGARIEPLPMLSLRPRGGLPMLVHSR
jgi:cytochrome P450